MKRTLFVLIMPFVVLVISGCKSTTYSYGPNGSKVTERESGVGTKITEEYYDSSTGLVHHRVSFIPDKKEEDKEDSKTKRIVLDLEGNPIFAFPDNRAGIVIKGAYEVHFFKEGLPKVLYTDSQNQKLDLLVLPKSSDDENLHYRTIRAGAKKVSNLDSRELIRERFEASQNNSGVIAHVKIENLPSNLSGEGTLCALSTLNNTSLCNSVHIQSSTGETAPITIDRKFLQSIDLSNNNSAKALGFTLKLNGLEKSLSGKLESAEITSNDNGISGEVHTSFSVSEEVAAALMTKSILNPDLADPAEKKIAQSRSPKKQSIESDVISGAILSISKSGEAL